MRDGILFLKMVDPGLYKMTDCNSAYTIADGKVPKMGANLREADVAKSMPSSLSAFKRRILHEINRQAQDKVSGKSPDR